jgi:hypothetical protein
MTLIALTSAKGAPGVTTTALALAMQWPRPVVLVEADLAGPSILHGFFLSQVAQDIGLGPLAVAHRHGDLGSHLREQAISLTDGATVFMPARHHMLAAIPDGARTASKLYVPGIPGPQTAPAVRDIWEDLAIELVSLERGGVDAIVDMGRLNIADDREPILQLADQVLVTTGSRLPDVMSAATLVTRRLAGLEQAAADLTNISTLVIGPGRPYPVSEITSSLHVANAGSISWDPVTAEVFAVGAEPTHRYANSPLIKSVNAAIGTIHDRVQRRRALLDAPHPEGS